MSTSTRAAFEVESVDPKPGWVYNADSGMCLGPASYELAEKFAKCGSDKMTTSYSGYPQSITIRPGPRMDHLPGK